MFKKIIQKILKVYAQKIIKKYKPKVIAVSGSVGKTSTKEFIYSVLKKDFKTRRNLKNFNNEIGVPLTIIGVKNPQFSFLSWLRIFYQAHKIFKKEYEYPEILVLEMGVDHPGDMDYLTDIAKPDIAVITTIGQSHLKYFKSVQNIQKEKGKLVEVLNGNGLAVLNFDNDLTWEIKEKSKAPVIGFGFGDCEARAQEFSFLENALAFKFLYKSKENKDWFYIENIINKEMVYDILPAIVIGEFLKKDLTINLFTTVQI